MKEELPKDEEQKLRARERKKRWREKNKEKCRASWNASRAKNLEKRREREREGKRRTYAADPEGRKERVRNWKKANSERVKESQRSWREANREAVREYFRRWRAENPEKQKLQSKRAYYRKVERAPERMMLQRRRDFAKKNGIPFEITIDDVVIPEVCPVLGIPLARSTGRSSPNSPSLDRIIPERGYVKGNVVVISTRANTLKRDGSPAELRALADWLERVAPKGDK